MTLLLLAALAIAGCTDEAPGAGGASSASSHENNLLPTPLFDEIDPETGLPVGWVRFAGSIGQTLMITDEDAMEGKYSLKGIQTATSTAGMYTAQRLPVKAGETYELTAWVKTIGPDVGAWIGIQTFETETSARTRLEGVSDTAPEWKKLQLTWTVPEGINYMNVILYTLSTNPPGTIYWNEPKLVKLN